MKTKTCEPFESNLEYLTEHLHYLRSLAALRARERKDENPEPPPNAGHPRSGVPAFSRRTVLAAERRLKARIRRTLEAGTVELPLETIAREHRLDENEKLILVAVLGPDLDYGFEQSLEAVMGHRCHPKEIRVVLSLLFGDIGAKIRARRYFIHSARLLADGLLNMGFQNSMDSESDFMSMELQIPRRVASLILGEYDVDDQVISFSSVIDPVARLEQVVLPPGKRDEVLRLVLEREECLRCRKEWGFDELMSYGRGMVMLFSGPPGTGKTLLAHALANAGGYRLMLVDLHKIVNCMPRHGFDENLQRVFHEARLQHAVLFFDEADEMFTDRSFNGAMPTLLRELERLDGICILATNRRQILDEALDRRIVYKLDFEMPTPVQRDEIWRRHLPPRAPLADDIDLRALTEEFEFSGGYIKNAVLTATTIAIQRRGAEHRISQADLRHAAALQRRNRLTAHADKVQPRVALSDVVVDDATRAEIESLIAAARHRATVFSTWGFGRRVTGGKGLAALLSGPSGTGKSLTAEAIAHELGQNLYPVRMDSLISKYVGETEKHLAAVFAAARETEAMVFFDEADSLFSRRLDDQDSHSHFINQQINVLLTELEKFDGMVLLATNRPEALDPAFERRLRYHIRLRCPDHETRADLWRKLLPPEAPLAEDVDVEELAEIFEFSGGTIRSVVLRAAFAAANDGQRITRAMLFRAAEAEAPMKQKTSVVGFRTAC